MLVVLTLFFGVLDALRANRIGHRTACAIACVVVIAAPITSISGMVVAQATPPAKEGDNVQSKAPSALPAPPPSPATSTPNATPPGSPLAPPVAQSKSRESKPKIDLLTFNISYAARIRMPPGSQLDVELSDSAGKRIAGRKLRTVTDSGPYIVALRVPMNGVYPLTAVVTLRSPAGHQLTAKQEIAQRLLTDKRYAVPIALSTVPR